MLLVASETGHVYTFATPKLQPMITSEAGKALIQTCLHQPDPPNGNLGEYDMRMSATGFEETELGYQLPEDTDYKVSLREKQSRCACLLQRESHLASVVTNHLRLQVDKPACTVFAGHHARPHGVHSHSDAHHRQSSNSDHSSRHDAHDRVPLPNARVCTSPSVPPLVPPSSVQPPTSAWQPTQGLRKPLPREPTPS